MKNLNILIADDNEMNLRYLEYFVRKWGFQYKIARNGNEAISCSFMEHFDFIFMDINMPIKNGFEATLAIRSEVKSKNKLSYIIAVSADSIIEQIEKNKDMGFNAFLPKPFTSEEVWDLLKTFSNKVI